MSSLIEGVKFSDVLKASVSNTWIYHCYNLYITCYIIGKLLYHHHLKSDLKRALMSFIKLFNVLEQNIYAIKCNVETAT